MTLKTLAITGGTGFVGRTLIAQALAAGWHVRALARKPQPKQDGVTWVAGALDDPKSLTELSTGADAIIHLAGVVNAPDRAGFEAGNVTGTRAMIGAAQAAGVQRFIHISSLSARLPALSNYGWSKAESEAVVAASPLDWTIIRPPGIFGAGDAEMRDVYALARRGLAIMPPNGHISLIAVEDLARLLLVLIPASESYNQTYEPDDGRDDWTHKSYAAAIGEAFGRRVRVAHLPKPLMLMGARIDRLLRGKEAKLTADRVNYLCHDDWRVDSARRPPPSLWQPKIDTLDGIKATLTAYRGAGWIK